MTENPPPGLKVTTVRLPADIHQSVSATADAARRSFNSQVIVLLAEALAARQREKADR